jgi:pyruvate/2-oxoglutarate dehydrogenase complex dihydrolipoamide acyltransferase (E2) component
MSMMVTPVLLPKLNFSMSHGVVAEWLVANGAAVKEGQPLYTLEEDKATQEVESPATGVLRIIAETGVSYEVGALVAEIT